MQHLIKWLPFALIAALLVLTLIIGIPESETTGRAIEVPYSAFKALVARKAVVSGTLQGNRMKARLVRARPVGPEGEVSERVTTRLPPFGDPALLPALERGEVEVQVGAGAETGGRRLWYGTLP